MALRFNPPPNWPAPPEGFNPPPGWQPDPAWGPAPEGWQLWIEDSVPDGSAGSAPQAGSAPDAGWAPTQAVPTGASAPVADPTGQSASAPSGDYAAGASPYAANMNYAQSPTPYHNQQQAPGASPQAAGWQPIDVTQAGMPGGKKPVTKQWWFWTIIGVVVLALVIGIVVALSGGDDDSDNRSSSTTTSSSSNDNGTSGNSSGGSSGGDQQDEPSEDERGTTLDNPGDPQEQMITFKASEYSDDPDATLEVEIGSVEWNANASLKKELTDSGRSYAWEEPPSGSVYMRVPVSVVYRGKGQMSSGWLSVDFVVDGNTTEPEYLYSSKEFRTQDMPRSGGKAEGYFTFLISEEDAESEEARFAVKGFYGTDEYYMQAKSF
ncbi:hypothetical protein CWT12_06260 [Actinomyces sp. 432]|uniref:hypothetical protein n=1 Tax=Actinomyces sp. 432 TaxID=2057798 RepID=UPI001373876A|nr:hypothetical protein [Actinomyces sp. 432]QHO91002.1 hypothetical protein CWT12_06260 [Actinomyces sp. 432]